MNQSTLLEVGKSLRRRQEEGIWEIDAPFYEPGSKMSYEHIFEDLIHHFGIETFLSFLESRKAEGKTANVLDLFGSGWFISDPYKVGNVIGFRLTDSVTSIVAGIATMISSVTSLDEKIKLAYAGETIQRFEEAQNAFTLVGNAYSLSDWKLLKQVMDEREINFFDLIVAKPEGAFMPRAITKNGPELIGKNVDAYKSFFLRLLDRAYRYLSNDGGVLVFQIPGFALEDFTDHVMPVLTNAGVEVHYVDYTNHGHGGAILRKNADSPANIVSLMK